MQPLNRLFLAMYGGAWRAAGPFLKRHNRLREGFEERLVPDSWPDVADGQSAISDKSPSLSTSDSCPDGTGGQSSRFRHADAIRIWIQAASGGEAWLLHSLLPELTDHFCRIPRFSGRSLHVLCTTCTRQGLEVLQKLPPCGRNPSVRIFSRYFPLDSPALMAKAMRLAAPHLVALLETELWPGLMAAARDEGIPVLVLNARMTGKSFSGYRLLRSFFHSVPPRRVLAVSGADAGRFADLFGIPERIGVMPNIKFDRLAAAMPVASASGLRREAGFAEESLLVVLASVREEEEDILLPVLRELAGLELAGGRPALALAPRHMHRIPAWRSRLEAAGIAWRLRSQCRNPGGGQGRDPGLPPLMLWDSFGDLLSLYAMADAVFVGGSLAPLGGQNFLEPASLGLVPVVGPDISNFHWVGEDFFEQGLGLRAGQEELAGILRRQLKQRQALLAAAAGPAEISDLRAAEAEKGCERFRRWLAPHLGGSRQAADLIVGELPFCG